ncbi:c-type cytochrome [Polynucleobacter rarus]|uniref:c-type cytochrome n=1 Tax=Polynucleobacter rarus TaxID=556055 RepID=UPI00131ED20A|nr:cytochrome c [Polynucleobacter rarus]
MSDLAFAQEEVFSKESIEKGRGIYSQNCSPCHGPQMADPQGAFDLRTFPPEQRNRFFYSVTNGKNGMPPWGGLFNKEEIATLWAYVMAGEKTK